MSLGRIRVAVGRLLRYLLTAAVTIFVASGCAWGRSPQTVGLVQSSTSAAQDPDLPTITAGQSSQTTPQNPQKPAIAPPALTIPRLTRAPALEDFLSMKPEGEIALQMAKVTGFVQRTPHDGEKASEETAAYLGYDQKNLYVVFVCFDDPKKVRARMSRREDIHDDDEVAVMFDTFHDRRRAYEFQTTPLGVQ